jgi:cbb3-type cytochrome oxidase maturation protein
MGIIFIMIGLSLLMAIGFLMAFIWSVKTGQQDDLVTPSIRIITEEIDLQKNKIK